MKGVHSQGRRLSNADILQTMGEVFLQMRTHLKFCCKKFKDFSKILVCTQYSLTRCVWREGCNADIL